MPLHCTGCGKEVDDDSKFCRHCGAQLNQDRRASASGFDRLSADSSAQQHWVARLIAYVIDVTAVLMAEVVFYGSLRASGSPFVPFFPPPWDPTVVTGFYGGLTMLFYAALMERYWGHTIGKRVVSLKTTSSAGGKPTLRQAFVRNVSKVFWLFLLLDIVGGFVTRGDYRERYLDRVAGTMVVAQARPA
ncbi:MAG: RDD family protein [Nitrososphaerota archaeon]|nr:RDD family protein [Nitrososphaerota archaeon]